ncbi:MAG: deoxyribonuclease IV [Calditrichaeota bacterium]|nr:MAG: deoxyribonuclease IV [Calditrichota bacterium]
MAASDSTKKPLRLGAHTSIAGGLYRALERGQTIGAEVVQIFAKNQMQWSAPAYRDEDVAQFRQTAAQTGVSAVTVHAAYLINPASPKPEVWQQSLRALVDELQRTSALGIPYLVVHPGSHLGEGEEAGLRRIADTLEAAYQQAAVQDVTLLLETTAGQGHNLGYRPEHLARILEQVPHLPLGLCLDTCHVFSAGYELRTREGWEQLLATFRATTGLDKIKVLHLNDSRTPIGSRRDRHARIGQGTLGLMAFYHLLQLEPLRTLPMVLEVPGGLAAYAQDLALLRKLAQADEEEVREMAIIQKSNKNK